jgi:ribosomal protein L16 Arg81 hydroxylase
LIQHHFFNLARENEKINNGPTDVFYNKHRPRAAIFKEKKWPSRTKFYRNYVSKSIPVVLRGYAKQFPAFDKWKTDEYIISKIGDVQVRVETSTTNHYTGDRSKMKFTLFSFEQFLQHYSQPDRKVNYYLAQTDMKNFEALHPDFPKYPHVFGKRMKHDVTQLWYGAGGQVTPMHFDENENMLCQIHGSRTFTLIDPYFNDMVYIDNEKTQVYTLVDAKKPDLEKYPLFKYTKQLKVHVNAGDCVYLPSYWYHMVESAPGRNVAVNWWYMPVSNIANTVWVGLSSRIWKGNKDPLQIGRKLGKSN